MIITVDIETIGQNPKAFICGSICYIYNKKQFNETFFKPKDMYNRIIELGIKEAKHGKNTDVYGWWHIFDFMGYADLTDVNLRFICNNPFIFRRECTFNETNLKKKRNNIISFYDAMVLYGCSLKKAAKYINKEKIEYDVKNIEKLESIKKKIEENNIDEEVKELIEYNKKDAELVLDLIINLKEMLKKYDIKPRHLISIGQISTNTIFNKIKKMDNEVINGIFEDKYKSKVIKPNYNIMNKQTLGGRGGRFEVFEFGEYENATKIDMNSAYSFADTNIRFPDLNSINIIEEPLDIMEIEELIKYIGMAKVILYHDDFEGIGIVPIRFKKQQMFPNNKEQILIGTWTHQELKYFIENGYKIKHVFYSIYYTKEIKNPFKEIIPKIYEYRKNGNIENVIFKRVLNYLTGKMKQKRQNIETRFINREDAYKLEFEGFKKIDGYGNLFLMEKKEKNYQFGKFFIGQVYADITAKIRLEITKCAKKIDKEDLIYIPCDALIFKNYEKYKDKINVSDKIGDFKIEELNGKGKVYSKQQYSINDNIYSSGVINANEQKKEFNEGILKTYKMINWKKDIKNAGMMYEETRDMNKSMEKMKNILDELNKRYIIIDELEFDEDVINYIKNNNLMEEIE